MKITEHPSKLIKRDFVETNKLTYQDIQNCTGISGSYLAEVFKKRKYLKPLDAIRLAKFFGKQHNYFVLLQARHQAAVTLRDGARKINQVRTLAEMKTAIQKEKLKVIRRATPSAEERPL